MSLIPGLAHHLPKVIRIEAGQEESTGLDRVLKAYQDPGHWEIKNTQSHRARCRMLPIQLALALPWSQRLSTHAIWTNVPGTP